MERCNEMACYKHVYKFYMKCFLVYWL